MTKHEVELTPDQYERAWQLTMALVQNEASARASLDMLFLRAVRFVAKLDGSVRLGEPFELDTGKTHQGTKVSVRVHVRGPVDASSD